MVFVATVSNLKAQQEKHFIFIQSENHKPFSVQLNDQNYNSTNSGYVTISQLLTGKYFITVSFPRNIIPQQKFIIDVNMNDWGTGYTLKQSSAGWNLINIVDSNIVVMNETELEKSISNKTAAATVIRDTAAVNHDTVAIKEKETEKNIVQQDTAVTAKIIVAEKPVDSNIVVADNQPKTNKQDTVSVNSDTVVIKEKEAEKNIVKQDTAVTTKIAVAEKPIEANAVAVAIQPKPNKSVIKTFEKIAASSIEQIYVVRNEKGFDTIAIFIPLNPVPKIVTPVKKCTAFATDEDFFNIRLAMAKVTTNDSMNVAAKSFFELKCYSVEQIKNLGYLYLTDSGRYKFFELAKPYISDSEKYASLQSQLSQTNWIEKFKASLQNN
ncbi:hypothetical protein GALL_46890 [mine drainage metagenome]|uniref:DUF4476 domain-containing protein n=1 Tax=mine drainage metagenome TaxID=410659 RepID=A0A1J5T235_9ZZZZ